MKINPQYEELIVVTEGELEILTRYPTSTRDSNLSKYNQPFLLKAPAAIHMDGRITRSVRNPSLTEPVKYLVAQCISPFDDLNEAVLPLERYKK